MAHSHFPIRAFLLSSLLTANLATAQDEPDTKLWDDDLVKAAQQVTLGPRPLFLVNDMSTDNDHERELKASLLNCAAEHSQWQR